MRLGINFKKNRRNQAVEHVTKMHGVELISS